MRFDDPTVSRPTGPGGPGPQSLTDDHFGRIGPYRLLSVLGEGGMGVVYLAEQTEPVQREVALKILKPGMDTRQIVARFEAERQALAVMDHPGIASVYDAGATDAGRPYFVMERVDGSPITAYCDAHRLTIPERVRLFIQVCRAVQHAHQKGVIHRDLKPSNVLVTAAGGEPLPKVIDFGIAKAIDTDGAARTRTQLTLVDQSIGTPAYMSPEQAEGSGLDIDTRTDIYALGVLLYELLTGVLPFDLHAYQGLAFWAQLARDTPAPSTRLKGIDSAAAARHAALRGTDAPGLRRQLLGDLDSVLRKMQERDRDQRYETVSAVALDLERYLRSEPVSAQPPSARYRAGKFVRRHRVGVAFAAILAVLLVGFAVAMGVQAGRVARARDVALVRHGQAEELIGFMLGDLRGKLRAVGRLDILDEVGARAMAYFAAVPESELSDDELSRRAQALRQLGEVRLDQGHREAAMDILQRSLELARALAARDPEHGEWQLLLSRAHFWVGYLHWVQSDYDAALAEFLPQRAILERLVERDAGHRPWREDLGRAHSNLGSIHEARGDLESAVHSLRAVLSMREQLAEDDPANRVTRLDVAVAHNKLAVVLQKLGRFEAATDGFRKELAIKESLALEQPADATMREHVALAHTYLARSLLDQGSLDEALPGFDTSVRLFRGLVEWDPANGRWRTGLGNRLTDLGVALGHSGQRPEAVTTLLESAATFEAVLRSDPQSVVGRRGLAASRRGLGRVYVAERKAAAALAELEAARRLLHPLLDEAPDDRTARLGLGETLLLEGDMRAAAGALGDAAATWAEARRVLEPLMHGSPEVQAQALWAAALLRTGDPAGAETLAERLRTRGYREPGFLHLTRAPQRPAAPGRHR